MRNAKNFYTDARESLHRNAEATTYASFPRDQSHMNTRQKKERCVSTEVYLPSEFKMLKTRRNFFDAKNSQSDSQLTFYKFYVVANARRFHHNILNSISLFASYCSFQVINLLASQKGLSIAAYFLL